MQPFPLLLVRHAAVQVQTGVCYGRSDVALQPGWESIVGGLAVLARGMPCSVVYTSPASRCHDMAGRLAQATGMSMVVDARLAELDFGQWEGQRWDDVARTQLDAWAADPEGFAPPGGESGRTLRARVGAFWQDIAAKGTAACVLSHGGPLRILASLAVGEVPDLLAPSMPQGFARLLTALPFAGSGQEEADPQAEVFSLARPVHRQRVPLAGSA